MINQSIKYYFYIYMSLVPINLQFKDFKFIAYKEGDELWFVAKVVCDYLLYSNSRVAVKSHCKKGGVKNN